MIYELLGVGEANARTAKELARVLDIKPRDVSRIVERERREEGRPICASAAGRNGGYYIAQDRNEMTQFCGKLHHRAGEIYKTRAACLKMLDALPESAEVTA